MAVRHGYGKIAGADALVFAYDTGDTRNSYRGEPTTNYTTDTPSQGGWTGTYDVLDSSRKTFRLNVSNFAADNRGWRSFTWDLRAYAGQSVTISATVEVPSSSPGTFAWIMMGQTSTHTNNGSGVGTYLGYSTASERVQKTSTTRERITWSGTLGNSGTASQPSGNVGFTVWYNDGSPGTNSYVEVSDVQIELKSHATPFVAGTRSATQGLLDLTGRSEINMTDTTFNSNSQIEFDGTSARAYSAGTGQFFNNNSGDTSFSNGASYEFVVKAYGTGYFVGVGSAWRISAGTNSFIFWDRDINAGGTDTRSGIGNLSVTNNYVHVVGVLDTISGEKRFYINGEEELNVSYGRTPSMGTTQLALGKSYPNSSDYCNCELPVGKVYTKALTADEVRNNFRLYKTRFGI